MAPGSPVTFLSIILPIALLLLGIGLMKVGFWPRRRGDTPHCRGCGYALLGNESGTCPECGREFTDATVLRGQRHRHKGIGLAGLTILLLGIAIGGGLWLTDIDWYRYLPQSWVVSDAASSNPSTARCAWDELLRRRAIAPLSQDVEKKLTDLALKEQASPNPGPMIEPMIEFVAQRYLDKKLSDQQIDQFFLNSVNPTLHTREVVAAGDVIPIQVTYRGRGPSNGWSYRLSTNDVKIGDKKIQMGGSMGGSGLGASGSTTTYLPGQPAGDYPLEAHVRIEIFRGLLGTVTPPVWTKDLTLKSTLKVTAKKADVMIKLTDRPDLAEQIKKSLRVEQFTKDPDGSYNLGIHIEKPPINVAFSVFARAGGKEFRMGDIAGDTTINMGSFMHPSGIGDIPVGKMQLIFRSDPAVARKTIDLVEIWRGEIVLDNVELKEKGK
jgi:hypothetical protein